MSTLSAIRRQYRPFALALSLCLTACAGTRVNNVVNHDPAVATLGVLPHTVAVVVDNDSAPAKKASHQAQQTEDAQQSVAQLTDGLNQMLAAHQLATVPAGQHADLVLHCRITNARSGNEVLRMAVGYGAGRAVLQTEVALDDDTGHTLLSFDTKSTTGAGKGPGMGLMDANGSAVAVIEAGVGGVRGLKKDLPHEVTQTTEHIDHELSTYFTSHHWPYAAATATPDTGTVASR